MARTLSVEIERALRRERLNKLRQKTEDEQIRLIDEARRKPDPETLDAAERREEVPMNQAVEMARRQRDLKAREEALAAQRAAEEVARELAEISQRFVGSLRPVAGVDPSLLAVEVAGLLERGSEEELAQWRVVELAAPSAAASRTPLYQRSPTPIFRTLELVPPGGAIPEGSRQVGTLKDLCDTAQTRRRRLDAVMSRPRNQAILISED